MALLPQADRTDLHNRNRLKIGLFGVNCSSGRAMTSVPERWSGSWDDCVRLAHMSDEAGIDFLLPIARWKGVEGLSHYQGEVLETISWACGMLAETRRLTVFGTVHAPLFHPLIAAKQFATADQIGHGRFGLNVVCGWNADEFRMFNVELRDHDLRYEHAQEWLDIIKRVWSQEEPFDFEGQYIQVRGVTGNPKPFGGSRPVIMNAGSSPAGRGYAVRNCDALFMNGSSVSVEETAKLVQKAKDEASAAGNRIDIYTIGVVICRPTMKEAQDYYQHAIIDNADWSTIDPLLAVRGVTPDSMPAAQYQDMRIRYARGRGGGELMVGDPEHVARELAKLSQAGLRGIAISGINYADELPLFRDEVLPRLERMGLRQPVIV